MKVPQLLATQNVERHDVTDRPGARRRRSTTGEGRSDNDNVSNDDRWRSGTHGCRVRVEVLVERELQIDDTVNTEFGDGAPGIRIERDKLIITIGGGEQTIRRADVAPPTRAPTNRSPGSRRRS